MLRHRFAPCLLAALALIPWSACTDDVPIDRDWAKNPAVATRQTAAEIVVVGDVHGGYDRLVALLTTGGLIARDAGAPAGWRWTGGDRVLVSVGDIIDKGDRAIQVIELLAGLGPQAQAAGGDVIVTLGNHEAEFLAEPNGDKAAEFRMELMARGVDPEKLRAGETTWGRWLVDRPLAAVVNGWFFAHGGNTRGRSVDELATEYRRLVAEGRWSSELLLAEDSLLEARRWWESDPQPKTLLDGYLARLGAKHIVFGHDPGALGTPGQIAQDKAGRIFLVDVGMSPAIDNSRGALLFITRTNGNDVSTAMEADGARRTLLITPP